MLIIDFKKCTGCSRCVLACSYAYEKEFSMDKAGIKLMKDEPNGTFIPIMCQHCSDAPCVNVCPSRALTINNETGIVEFDENKCIGCKMCVQVCPFGLITFGKETGKPLRCDLCGGEPECAKACFSKAIRFEKLNKVGNEKIKDTIVKYLTSENE